MTYRSIGRQFDWDMEKYRVGNCDFRVLTSTSTEPTREECSRTSLGS